MSNLSEVWDVVNKEDEVVGKATRGEVYQKGLLHRCVNIFLLNSKGQIYLQQRSKEKLVFPLAWDLSASEHLLSGESYEGAAKRGLTEELGIGVEVEKIRSTHFQDNSYAKKLEKELVETYKAIFDGEIKIDKREVNDGKFFSKDTLNEMVKNKKEIFTPWFLEEWETLEETS